MSPLKRFGTVSLFLWEVNFQGADIEKARTIAFATIIMFELFHVFNARSLHTTIFNKGFFKNKHVFYSIGLSLSLTLWTIYSGFGQSIFDTVPLMPSDWATILIVSSTAVIFAELIKLLAKSEFNEQSQTKGYALMFE